MNSSEPNPGKTLIHGSEAGEITRSLIERRAHEIALIEGHPEATAQDRRNAREELRGRTLPETMSEDAAGIASSLSRDPSEPLSIPGRQTPVYNEDDDQDTIERLTIEGVEEAQHDQMLAARRTKRF